MSYVRHSEFGISDVYEYEYNDRFYCVKNFSNIKKKFNALCRDIRDEKLLLDWKNIFTFSHTPIFDTEMNEIKKEYDRTAMDVVDNIVHIPEDVCRPQKIYVVVRKYYYREEENTNPELHFPFCNRRICKDSINYSLYIICSYTHLYNVLNNYGKIVCDTMPSLNIILKKMLSLKIICKKMESKTIEDFLNEFYIAG